MPKARPSARKGHKKEAGNCHGGVRGHVGESLFYYWKTTLFTLWRLAGGAKTRVYSGQGALEPFWITFSALFWPLGPLQGAFGRSPEPSRAFQTIIDSTSEFHADSGPSPKGQGATRLRHLVEPPPLKLPSSDGLRPCFRANSSLGPGLKPRPSFRYIYTWEGRQRKLDKELSAAYPGIRNWSGP